jgi:flavodoxin
MPPARPSASDRADSGGTGSSPRVLIAYFSRPGENYYFGDRIDLEVGNTEVLSRAIAARLDEAGVAHTLHRIEPAEPYSQDYDETVARNVREQESDARPAIANPLDSISEYDVVLVGSPIWNVRPPRIMLTFTESHDFTGKTIHPFVTHAMSGLGNAEADYRSASPEATLGAGLAVRGETVRRQGPPAAEGWLADIGLA